jgi:hypothetical protein
VNVFTPGSRLSRSISAAALRPALAAQCRLVGGAIEILVHQLCHLHAMAPQQRLAARRQRRVVERLRLQAGLIAVLAYRGRESLEQRLGVGRLQRRAKQLVRRFRPESAALLRAHRQRGGERDREGEQQFSQHDGLTATERSCLRLSRIPGLTFIGAAHFSRGAGRMRCRRRRAHCGSRSFVV